MEEVTMAAKALYKSFSAAEKREIQSWFRSIDGDGDGRVSIPEFSSFMQDAGDDYTRALFNLLDHNGDGFLQRDELFTLCYIQASGRPMCDACGNLILGLYFTCTHCRLTNHFQNHSFDLCVPCYPTERFVHDHSEFDDNYTLLVKMQEMLLPEPQARPAHGYPSSSSSTRLKASVMSTFKAFVEGVVQGAFS